MYDRAGNDYDVILNRAILAESISKGERLQDSIILSMTGDSQIRSLPAILRIDFLTGHPRTEEEHEFCTRDLNYQLNSQYNWFGKFIDKLIIHLTNFMSKREWGSKK
jgi:hypothetical protein